MEHVSILGELGSGCYATTYEIDGEPDKVYQSSRDDDGKREYLQIAVDNQHNTLFPKVYYLEYNEEFNELCIIMERLTERLGRHIEDLADGICRRLEMGDTDPPSGVDTVDWVEFIHLTQDLVNLYPCDVHVHNIMFDNDGRLVITDPFAGD